jgi:hypothetical protein
MSWKLPIAYFMLPDGFPSVKRAELIRLCLYKLNCTGAIVTNLVMDNCAVNYATFRFLGCKLSRCYEDLNTATDIKNNMGKHVLALFDPPHLAKLGIFLQITMVAPPHHFITSLKGLYHEIFNTCFFINLTSFGPLRNLVG